MDEERPPRKKWVPRFFSGRAIYVVLGGGWCLFLLAGVVALVCRWRLTPGPAVQTVCPTRLPTVAVSPTATECTLEVEVLDTQKQPLRNQDVLLTDAFWTAPAPAGFVATGELGVLSSALPYPEDVIAGVLPKPPATPPTPKKEAPSILLLTQRTDSKGIARWKLVPEGLYQLTVHTKTGVGQTWVRRQPKGGACAGVERVVVVVQPLGRAGMLSAQQGTSPLMVPIPSQEEAKDVPVEVVDRQKRPVGSALVQVQGVVSPLLCMTNSEGRCTLSHVPRQDLILTVRIGARTPTSHSVALSEWTTVDVLSLVTGGENGIEGTVHDARAGLLRTGARLWLRTEKDKEQPLVIDDKGRFAAEGIPAGPVVLRVQAPGYVTVQQTVEVPAQGWLRDIRIDLQRAGAVEGRVRLAAGGEPKGVSVRVLAMDEKRELGHATVDRRGEYRIEGLTPGDVWVVAGAARMQVQVYPEHTQRVPELEVR